MFNAHRKPLELYVKSPHPVLDSIGVYFTTEDILYEKKKLQDIKPLYYLGEQNRFNKKDTNWQKVEIDFVATGRENFVTLANFSRNDITGPTGIRFTNEYNVYVDDISLIPLDGNEQICSDWQQRKQEIYDQNERHQYLDRLVRMQRYNTTVDKRLTTPTILVSVDTLVMSDILFETGKSILQPASFSMLDSLCKRTRRDQLDSVVIRGHTDNTGQAEKNEKLSIDRAIAVAAYLKQCGLKNIRTKGFGNRLPVAGNQDPEGRQRNRRVEILLYIRE